MGTIGLLESWYHENDYHMNTWELGVLVGSTWSPAFIKMTSPVHMVTWKCKYGTGFFALHAHLGFFAQEIHILTWEKILLHILEQYRTIGELFFLEGILSKVKLCTDISHIDFQEFWKISFGFSFVSELLNLDKASINIGLSFFFLFS